MTYVVAILVVAFAVICVFYLCANDFSKETLDVVFPVVGAILLSVYLGFKAVVIDGPAPTRFGGTVAVILDEVSGETFSVPRPSLNFPLPIDEYRGAQLIETLPLYNAFASLDLPKRLRQSGTANSLPPEILDYLVEYSVLSWLTYPDLAVGAENIRTARLISGGGSSVGVPTDLRPVRTDIGGMERNPFIQANPITLRLPAGSRVARLGESPLAIQITTRQSTLRMTKTGLEMERLAEPSTPDAEKLFRILDLPRNPQHLILLGYRLEFEAVQCSWSRNSWQAKREAVWIARIQRQFHRDFSWERVRRVSLAKGD